MKLGKADKQPADTLDYDVSYKNWLRSGETITDAEVTITPSGLTLSAKAVSDDFVKVLISGGTVGVRYKVEVTATTSLGVTRQDEFFLNVKEY